MHLLTLEQQLVRELQEVLEVERLLIGKIPLIGNSLEGLSIEFLRSYLSKKYDQAEALEEILKSLGRDLASLTPHESSLLADIESQIQERRGGGSASIAAFEEIAELLRMHYKKLADHARILGISDAEELLDQAHVAEANVSIALTRFEFHHAATESEKFSSASH